ncbi:MAG: chemotaxis protein CheX [Steroidobacteraceae bacterium]
MAQESEVATFVAGILHYFETMVQQAAQVGTPYLALGKPPRSLDYTGMIRISGTRQGAVYFTAPKGMLSVMLMRMQETNISHDNLCDLVGEVANTLSGNARRDFGAQFVISVPQVVHGADSQLSHPADARPIVIPIDWRNYHASLVVCLN